MRSRGVVKGIMGPEALSPYVVVPKGTWLWLDWNGDGVGDRTELMTSGVGQGKELTEALSPSLERGKVLLVEYGVCTAWRERLLLVGMRV